jgi:NAD(P)-dependent dehydrogenase (short-subunit alcohol dehydrogenase family)
MACRTESKAQVVIEEIQKETGNSQLEFVALDLMSLASVKSFVETIKEKHAKIDILMNNAGVMMCPFGLSSDGKNPLFLSPPQHHVADKLTLFHFFFCDG